MAELEDAVQASFSVRSENVFSPEDLAWVDSCLVDNHQEMFVVSSSRTRTPAKDEYMTGSDSSDLPAYREEPPETDLMNSGISSAEEVSEILSLLTFESDPSMNSLQDDDFSVHENASVTMIGTHDHVDNLDVPEDVERTESGSASGDETEPEVLSRTIKENLVGPSIPENAADPIDDFSDSEDQIKLSQHDIFKVWDLKILESEDEEDEFGKLLKNVSDESLKAELLLSEPHDDDLVLPESCNIDDLIAGISDLAITKSVA